MSRAITISLPVSNLQASKAFYTAIGFINNRQFVDDHGAFMSWSEAINIILFSHEKWQALTKRPIAPKTSSEVGLTLLCDSRADVDEMSQAASENGGTADINPIEDYGFMYGRDFIDPDGHVWGVKWFDLTASPSSYEHLEG
jgi:uncharacterized protein